MEQDKLIIIHEALNEASYLISNEIQCVIDEELYSEYNRVLEKIDRALQIIKKYKSPPLSPCLGGGEDPLNPPV